MQMHPDHVLFLTQCRVNRYDQHAAIHRPTVQAALRVQRHRSLEGRWFRLRYRIRSFFFRFVPHIARRLAL